MPHDTLKILPEEWEHLLNYVVELRVDILTQLTLCRELLAQILLVLGSNGEQ